MAKAAPGGPTLEVPGVESLTPLGRGGFATVYDGWQPAFHRRVAVKVLDASAADPEVAARFGREVRAMGALSDHPYVVPVYDAGIVDDRPYLVMPRLSDESLEDQLRHEPLDEEEVVRLGVAMADALAAAHRVGLLHRDVKPANILRTPYGEPKLADFGIARFTDATATLGQLSATVGYAAPEVLAGEPATPSSDVYSLGATLHAALRGAPPFEPRTDEVPVATAVRVLSNEPPDLAAAGVAPALAEVVGHAMAKDPGERYPTAEAFRDALAAVAADDRDRIETVALAETLPVSVPEDSTAPARPQPPEPAPRVQRQQTPRWWRPAALLLALALVGGVTAAALYAGRDDDGSPTSTTVAARPADNAPARVAVPQAEARPTTTTATSTTATPVAGGESVEVAVGRYYGLLDEGRIDEAFDLLTPAYQARSGESSYRGFWRTIDRVEVLAVHPEGSSARPELRYTRTDGSTVVESTFLRFVRDRSGRLLIDGNA